MHTAIDDSDICPERLAREIRHVAHIVAKVPNGKKPMEEGGPDGDPGHEAWVQGYVVSFYDVEDGVVEQRYQPRDTHNRQGLRAQNAEDDASQCGREEGFIYAVEAAGVSVHVEDEG